MEKGKSLKDLLHSKIKELGYLSYGQVMQIAAEEGYKGETATRRLRELTDIEPVISKSKRGTNYISGYKPKPEIVYKSNEDVNQLFTYKVYEPVTHFKDPL